MKRFTTFAASAVMLVSCSALSPQNDTQASIVAALETNLAPGVNAAISHGLAATTRDLQMLKVALPWAERALEFFGPVVGVSPATISELLNGAKFAEAVLANPADVGAAVVQATQLYQQIKNLLGPALKG